MLFPLDNEVDELIFFFFSVKKKEKKNSHRKCRVSGAFGGCDQLCNLSEKAKRERSAFDSSRPAVQFSRYHVLVYFYNCSVINRIFSTESNSALLGLGIELTSTI